MAIPTTTFRQIPSVVSTTKQTTELTSLTGTSIQPSSLFIQTFGQRYLPTVPSVTRFSTFIKTSNDPIVDTAAEATISQTWTVS
jgi:hypothetical protein